MIMLLHTKKRPSVVVTESTVQLYERVRYTYIYSQCRSTVKVLFFVYNGEKNSISFMTLSPIESKPVQ